MNLGSIWDRFGSIWGLGRIFGGFGAPLSAQYRILIDFTLVLGPLVGPSRPQFGGLDASWASCGCLWAVVSPFISVFISDPFSDFILHRFWTAKLRQNHLKIKQKVLPKPRKKKTYFDASSIEISRDSDAEAKKVDLQKLCKNLVFLCIFWICAYVDKEQKHFGNQCRKASKIRAKITDFLFKNRWFRQWFFHAFLTSLSHHRCALLT